MIEPDPASAAFLVTADGKTNVLGWLLCRVTPVEPYRNEPWSSQLLGELLGERVRIGGTWCDQLAPDGVPMFTTVEPMSWVVVDRKPTPFVEEFGFTQVVRDADVFAFSDDGDETVPHRREDRHVAITVPYPPRPQPTAAPSHHECVDREPAEAMQYDYDQKGAPPRFPLFADRAHSYSNVASDAGDTLRLEVDTGSPAGGRGFFYAKLSLTYVEPFEEMCLPDVCLDDPTMSCQATGETRRTYAWPHLASARVGDILHGPASGNGIIGSLLGALRPAQRYDHCVLFVEDDGRTIRHVTAAEDRLKAEEYFNGPDKLDILVADVNIPKVPLRGLRADIVRYGWPGSITQSIGEVTLTGRNRLNPRFSFGDACPDLLVTEATAKLPSLLWQLAPAEREKRTAFHEAEATATARRTKDAGKRLKYSLTRLQTSPAPRADVELRPGQTSGLLWPRLVKPHPFLEVQAREALRVVASAARRLDAHYRFFAYSNGQVARDPAFAAPPQGDPAWPDLAGSDWAAGTVAAMCSSFVWAAVQDANEVLVGAGRPWIQLEGETDAGDDRPPAGHDGLYEYQREERVEAAEQLFGFMFDKVARKINAKLEDLSFPSDIGAWYFNIDGTIDDVRDFIATVVANQICNTFASDDVDNLSGAWTGTGVGVTVSPDDTFRNWDIRAALDEAPPAAGGGRINVYGHSLQIAVPEPGWVDEPIYRKQKVFGTGAVRGTVVRREPGDDHLGRVVGATVRLGCQVRSSDVEANWEVDPMKAGRYHVSAAMFIVDRETGVGLEWKSEPRELEISDGDMIGGLELELLPPPGLARNVMVQHHADVVDRVVVGKDRWGHFDQGGTVHLAYDPREPQDAASATLEDRNTKTHDTYDQTTPQVGSGVQVRVRVDARLHPGPRAQGSVPYDGSVELDVHLTFFDTSEGETNDTIDKWNILVGVNEMYEIPYNLVSDDTVPERASGTIRIHNVLAVLPS